MEGDLIGNKPGGGMRGSAALAVGAAALLIGGMALGMPHVALEASLRGVKVWWEVLFPALFPFFVLSEVLLGSGVVHLAGTLLDPFMRPLFRLPGAGGFVVAMGFASGYPVGARLTSRLIEQKMVNRPQGERLVEMTTTSDPIFLIGAVAVGFFGRPEAAPVLALAHYGGAMLLGVVGRWRKDGQSEPAGSDETSFAPPPSGGRLKAAVTAMHRARMADGRPFGVLLNHAMQSSLTLMMIVGGLVVFFSASLDLLLYSGVLSPLRDLTGWALHAAGLPGQLAPSFIQGSFEVTLGARAAAIAEAPGSGVPLPLVDRLAAAAFVLSWAGLSVHAQVAGLMSRTGWRYAPFARTRFYHGLIAMLIVYASWPFMQPLASAALPVWFQTQAASPAGRMLWPPLMAAAVLGGLIVAGTIVIAAKRLQSWLAGT